MKNTIYVYETKKGNECFQIGKKTYVIIKRPADEIGSNNNYAKKLIIPIDE